MKNLAVNYLYFLCPRNTLCQNVPYILVAVLNFIVKKNVSNKRAVDYSGILSSLTLVYFIFPISNKSYAQATASSFLQTTKRLLSVWTKQRAFCWERKDTLTKPFTALALFMCLGGMHVSPEQAKKKWQHKIITLCCNTSLVVGGIPTHPDRAL